MAAPDLTVVVHGAPAPQGSKRYVGGRMVESSKAVVPWRNAVTIAAAEARGDEPLDGPLAVAMTFTMGLQPASRPTWWTPGVRWSKTLRWRPASAPDLSKLARATEDALTDAAAWRDDARVVEYRRLAKHYIGDPAADVLPTAGAVIHIWRIGHDAEEAATS